MAGCSPIDRACGLAELPLQSAAHVCGPRPWGQDNTFAFLSPRKTCYKLESIRHKKSETFNPYRLRWNMPDLHVEWLEYELTSNCEFSDPPPLDWDTPLFAATLDRGILRLNLKDHFATEDAARLVVEPFLKDWEFHIALRFGQRGIGFAFKNSRTVDRDPPQPGVAMIIGAGASVLCAASITAVGTVTLKSYPPPPSNFRATPDVIDLWTQFEQYQKQREQLAKMCYACLSLLEDAHGGRRAVSKALSVDFEVLDRLGELSTNRGKRSNARKVTRDLRPMTGKESRWLEAIIPELILRTGQIAAGYSPAWLTMKQLPPL